MGVCKVRFATIGNHEFDVRERLRDRLAEASFRTIAANLKPPAHYPAGTVQDLAFWPAPRPFLAITGLAGKQTRDKAIDSGWSACDPNDRIKSIIEGVSGKSAIRALIILTHMGRDEDLELADYVRTLWPSRGAVYVIAGHDHDIDWSEPQRGRVFVSKALSNAKSVTVIPILRDLLGSLGWPVPELEPSLTDAETEWAETIETQISGARGRRLHALLEQSPAVDGRCRGINDVIRAYRANVPAGVRPEFRRGFEHRLRSVYRRFISVGAHWCTLEGSLARVTAEQAEANGRGEAAEAFYAVPGRQLIDLVPPDPAAQLRVLHWQQQLQNRRPLPDDVGLVDLGGDAGDLLDATDDKLRKCSTDFGNFCADAVKSGSNADIALINSGSFRLDDKLPRRLGLRHLYDVFLYDGPTAGVVVRLSTDEVIGFYEHAIARGGHGAFLQVSESVDQLRSRPKGTIEVALIKHMLKDREDDFRELLAMLRSVSEDVIANDVAENPVRSGSTIGWVEAGCRNASIRYCNDPRVSAGATWADGDMSAESWKSLVKDYDDLCDRAGLSQFDRFLRLTNPPSVTRQSPRPFDRELDRRICEAHIEMIDFIRSLRPPGEGRRLRPAVARLVDRLDRERIPPEQRRHFTNYLKNIIEWLEPSMRGVMM